MKGNVKSSPEPQPLRLGGATREERAIGSMLGRLPDAAPDELQVQRVWHRLHRPQSRPPVAWRWATAVVLILVLVVGGGRLWLTLARTHAEVLAIEGGVFAGGAGMSWVPARSGDPIPPGGMLRSDASGQGLLQVPGVAALMLGVDADLVLERLGRSTVLNLERGIVTAHVTKRPPGSTFVVRVGDFTVSVVGTTFSVSEETGGRVTVSVQEGAVEVTGRGSRWRVESGERWSSDAPGQRSSASVSAGRVALLLAATSTPPSPDVSELFRRIVLSEASPALVAPPPAPAATPTPTPVPSPMSPTQSPTVLPPYRSRPSPAGFVASPAVPSHSPPQSALGNAVDGPPPAPPNVVPNAAGATPPPPAPSVSPSASRDLYAEALALTRQGSYQEAAQLLERALASGAGPRDLELYQLAMLRQHRLGDPQGALDALLTYRQQYPSGALRQEVNLSIIEADLTLGREDAALAESAHVLERYPASERTDELRLLRGDLLRQHGDFAAASAEYRSITHGPAFDDALYYAAFCLSELGDTEGAAVRLREYLARFPSGRHAAAARQALGQ